MSIGLLEIMNGSNVVNYNRSAFSLADLEKAMSALPPTPRSTVIYTDSYGMETIDFSCKVGQLFPGLRTFMYIPRRVKGFIYVSLFQKHSLYKMKLYTDGRRLKYELIYGTKIIGKSDSIETIRIFIRQKEQEDGKGN